ncbi:hypothetical protein PALU110988_29925 [Paenibacillus lupini]|uniref:hypothetical protein n=1 Tax=Paenibacillus lupini TaxID=1450204 RepID=UPI00141F643C|nr:hypothetical protein [Paenibacillus lupini]NIK25236.1 hypothetical protein [Paenibacillus lupini]
MNKWKITLSGVVIAVALTGCGSKSEDTTTNTTASGQAVQQDQQQGSQQGQGQGRAMMGTIGKIKAINGQTITIYKSSFERPEGGGMGGNGAPPQGDAPAGNAADTGNVSAGDAGAASGNGQAPSGDRQRNMENMFSDETMDITVTDSTKIISATFADGKMTETDKTLADLKADDIITVQLKDDTQEAESIRIGGFGGGFGGGGRGQFQNGGAHDGQQPADEQQTTTK